MNPMSQRRYSKSPAVVALGGGHGLAASLRALRHVTPDLTAVVTVADDGGSSGRLRQEFGILPPGDLRMALSALCDSSQWGQTWRDVLQYRFDSHGPLHGHAVGNLLITALWELIDDPIAGLEWIGKLLEAEGRVLPMALDPLEIEADIDFGDHTETIRGQSQVAVSDGTVSNLRLIPDRPRVPVEVVDAIMHADWVILGPGSWFTSVIPHLLVPDLAQALKDTDAKIALTLNLVAQVGETAGYSAADHLRSLQEFTNGLAIDVVIADPTAIEDLDDVVACTAKIGATLLLRQVRSATKLGVHDPLRLAGAYRDAFDYTLGDVTAR